ncbi:MAG: ABC transporter permease subunit [Clostridiales bacterium]
MTLYNREIRSNLKVFLIWTLVIILINIMFLAMFPSYADQADEINEMMKNFPEEMIKAIDAESTDFSDPIDYLAYMFQYITLAAAIMAMIMGISIISKEESEGTIEFLFAKPITKIYIVTNKLLSVLTQIVVFPILFTISSYMTIESVVDKEYNVKALILLGVSLFFIQLIFAVFGFIISIFVTKVKKTTPLSLGIVFVMFFISMMSKINESMESLKHITPFRYFEPTAIVENTKLNGSYITLTIVISILCLTGTYILYNRKDIKG